MFYANRAWDERSEKGYMKDIEDEYQAPADRITAGPDSLTTAECPVVTKFVALWSLREATRTSPTADAPMAGVAGEPLAADQRERTEKFGASYVRSDGKMPGRMLAGMLIQRGIDRMCADFQGMTWGIARATEGEFICPDTFGEFAAVPLSPMLCLLRGRNNSELSKGDVAAVNQLAYRSAKSYCLARDFAACPR